MKSLIKYISEKLVINKDYKNIENIETILPQSGKWYMTAEEVKDALDSILSSSKKPAKFIFNNTYILFPDYDSQREWGVSEQFIYNEKIWYCSLSSEEKNPKTPACEVISYNFNGANPKDIICEGDKWRLNNGVYNAKNKKFRITSIYEDTDYIVFTINNSKQ